MKKLSILFSLILALVLAGCSSVDTVPAETPVESTAMEMVASEVPTVTTMPETEMPDTLPPETEPEQTVPEGAVALSGEELAEFQNLFNQPGVEDGVYPPTNWYNMAMGCHFENPAQLDLARFFCEGAGGEDRLYQLTEAETAFLRTQPQISMELDISRISAGEMEAVMQRYFGCGLEETEKVRLDAMAYYPNTDCYYYSKGDTKFVWDYEVTAGYTLSDGSVLVYWSMPEGQEYAMNLRMGEEGYQIRSNLFLNMEKYVPIPNI